MTWALIVIAVLLLWLAAMFAFGFGRRARGLVEWRCLTCGQRKRFWKVSSAAIHAVHHDHGSSPRVSEGVQS